MKDDDSPEVFLSAPRDRFLAMTDTSLQKLQPAGWDVVYTSQGAEHPFMEGPCFASQTICSGGHGPFQSGSSGTMRRDRMQPRNKSKGSVRIEERAGRKIVVKDYGGCLILFSTLFM